jgi:hypothetical protein
MLQTEAYLMIVITIVIYDCKTFIIQATGQDVIKLFMAIFYECLLISLSVCPWQSFWEYFNVCGKGQ